MVRIARSKTDLNYQIKPKKGSKKENTFLVSNYIPAQTKDKKIFYPDTPIEVIAEEINRLVKEYVNEVLFDPNDIYNRQTFTGLILYIYNNVFKATLDLNTGMYINKASNNNSASIIDYSDIDKLYSLLDIYIFICSMFKQEITKYKFCLFLNLDRDIIDNWKINKDIPDVKGKERARWRLFSIKLSNVSELSLSDAMLSGNLMAYAQLKCWYGWTETPRQIAVVNTDQPVRSVSEIASRYMLDDSTADTDQVGSGVIDI